MKIKIIQKQCGGTEFLCPAAPAAPRCTERRRGGRAAASRCRKHGPGAPLRCTCAAATAPCWRRSRWTPQHRVTVDRRLTGSTGGQWMLAAMGDNGYTAYTRPGSYDVLRHPAHRRRRRGAAALAVRAVRGPRAGKLQQRLHGGTARRRQCSFHRGQRSAGPDRRTAHQRRQRQLHPSCAARAEAAAARAEELVPTDGQVVQRQR